MKTQFVNPKEKILEDLSEPIREAVLSAITPIISNAMTMYSDQQNKYKDAEIQRLMKELDEVKTSHYQQLNDSLVEDHEKALAEIQRLTKEVGELKLRLSGKTFFNPFEQENTRLRELLEKIMAYFDDGTIVRDTSRDGDSDFHERMISFVKLLTEISTALNHKP